MCLQPMSLGAIPADTVRVAKAAFPKGNPCLLMRDKFGTFYQDAAFADLFSPVGQPALAPWRLSLVTVFQFAEGLTDRQAANAVRSRIDWKYALGLELEDPGFDPSVLCEFRGRLLEGGAERRLLDLMLLQLKAEGFLKERGRQRTDSSHVLAATRTINRLETVGETLRAALNSLAVMAPEWLRDWVPAEWYDRYGPRIEAQRFPKEAKERQALAETTGADGLQLLGRVAQADAPAWLREVPAVQILRQIWVQQYWVQGGKVGLRPAGNLPPSHLMLDSPYDPDARYGQKRGDTWSGYKVHLTESCDDQSVHLITDVQTTVATTADARLAEPIQTELEQKELLPREHLMDAGYVDAGLLVQSQAQRGVEVIGPVREDTSWQARTQGALDLTQFEIDWEQQRVICPHGKESVQWTPSRDRWDSPCIEVRFLPTDCKACPSREHCTRAPARELTLRPQAEYEALTAARKAQRSQEWKQRYRRRAGIEGTISEGVRAYGLRHCRYLGRAKAHLQHVATATAINWVRMAAWLSGSLHAQTRTSAFARLAPAA